MSNTEEKSLFEHFDDFKDGFYKTFVETPIDFGDFLARVSGIRDYQLYDSVIDLGNPIQTQALLELRAVYETIKDDNSRAMIFDIIWEDMKERPMYYTGNIGTGMALSSTIKFLSLKATYFVSSSGTKIDSAAHQNFENAKDILKMTDGEFNTYVANTIDNIDLFKNNEGTIFDYIKEAGIDKVKIGDETYTIQKDNPLFLNNQNTPKLEIVNPVTNEKTVYSVDTNNNNNLTPEYKTNITTGATVLLKSGQTISHIAVGTDFTIKELLQYNGLTEEDANSLPVGYEVQIPKDVKNIEGGYGNVKVYEEADGSLTYYIPSDDNGSINVVKLDKEGNVLRNDFDESGAIILDKIVVRPEDNQSYIDAKKLEELLKDPDNLVSQEEVDNADRLVDSEEIKSDAGGVGNQDKDINWGGTINTTINQIGSIIISNQDFSNVEKIVVSSSVAKLANFAEYKYSGS